MWQAGWAQGELAKAEPASGLCYVRGALGGAWSQCWAHSILKSYPVNFRQQQHHGGKAQTLVTLTPNFKCFGVSSNVLASNNSLVSKVELHQVPELLEYLNMEEDIALEAE